jgi:DNA-binding response OmpR family regulator
LTPFVRGLGSTDRCETEGLWMQRTDRKRVLIIGDDAERFDAMSFALEAAGIDAAAVAGASTGLGAQRTQPYDLVVVDMAAPVRAAAETIVALKRSGPVRVLALSDALAAGPEYYLVLARHVGADAVTSWPCSMSALTRLITQMLEAPPLSAPDGLSGERLEATLELADRLDDAVMIARLMMAKALRSQGENACSVH